MKIGADSVIVLDIRQYAGVLFLVIIRFSLAEKSCGVFAREKWRQRKRGAVGRLAPVNATRNVGRYLYPQKPYVLLLSEGITNRIISTSYLLPVFYVALIHYPIYFIIIMDSCKMIPGNLPKKASKMRFVHRKSIELPPVVYYNIR